MNSRFLHILALLSLCIAGHGQLQPLLDQPHLNGLAINPAYAGSLDALNVGIQTRSQWIGFEGAPRTHFLSVHTPLRNKKVNLGLVVLGDRLGSKRETGFLLNYAYRMELGAGKLSLGLAAGLANINTDLNALRYTDPGDQILQDPAGRAVLPEFSIGGYYQSRQYFVGISMPLFLSHPVHEGTGHYRIGFQAGAANYLLSAGYLFRLSQDFELLPTMLLRSNPANNTQLDIHANLIYKERFWIGTSIRTSGSASALLQIQVNPQLRLGYSYAREFSELSSYQNGSHEIVIQYNFRYLLNVISPRYF